MLKKKSKNRECFFFMIAAVDVVISIPRFIPEIQQCWHEGKCPCGELWHSVECDLSQSRSRGEDFEVGSLFFDLEVLKHRLREFGTL